MFSVSTVSVQSEPNTDLSVSLFLSGLGDWAANRLWQMHSGTFCGIGLQTSYLKSGLIFGVLIAPGMSLVPQRQEGVRHFLFL